MPNGEGGLEQRIQVLEEFVDSTKDIGWLRSSVAGLALALVVMGKGDQEPAKTFQYMKSFLQPLLEEEQRLQEEYDRIMWRGEYANQDGFGLFRAWADETRRAQGLPEGAPVELVEGSLEYKKILAERNRFLEGKRHEADKSQALGLLVETVMLRAETYAGSAYTLDNAPTLASLGQDNPLMFRPIGSDYDQVVLEGKTGKLRRYISEFSIRWDELRFRYPGQELLEHGRALTKRADQPQR